MVGGNRSVEQAAEQARASLVTLELDGVQWQGRSFDLVATLRLLGGVTLRTDEGTVELAVRGGKVILQLRNGSVVRKSVPPELDPPARPAQVAKSTVWVDRSATSQSTSGLGAALGPIGPAVTLNATTGANEGARASVSVEFLGTPQAPFRAYQTDDGRSLTISFDFPDPGIGPIEGKVLAAERVCSLEVEGESKLLYVNAELRVSPRQLMHLAGTGLFALNLPVTKRRLIDILIAELVGNDWPVAELIVEVPPQAGSRR